MDRQLHIYATANYILYIYHVTIIISSKKLLRSAESFLIICYTASYDWNNSMPIWLCYNYLIHSVH